MTVLLPSVHGYTGFILGGAFHFFLFVPGLLAMFVGVRHYLRHEDVVLTLPTAVVMGLFGSGMTFLSYYFFNWFLWLLANSRWPSGGKYEERPIIGVLRHFNPL